MCAPSTIATVIQGIGHRHTDGTWAEIPGQMLHFYGGVCLIIPHYDLGRLEILIGCGIYLVVFIDLGEGDWEGA